MDDFMSLVLQISRYRSYGIGKRGVSQSESLGKGFVHARDIRLDAGEKPESFGRLMHAHASAGERACAFSCRCLDEGSFDWRINYVRGPVTFVENGRWYWIAREAMHPDRRGVDYTVRGGNLRFKIARYPAA
jgi:hypothetical protein